MPDLSPASPAEGEPGSGSGAAGMKGARLWWLPLTYLATRDDRTGSGPPHAIASIL